VGVGKHHVGENAGIEGQHPVLLGGIPAAALEEPAIKQNAVPLRCNEMHGAGDFAHRSVEGHVHSIPPFLAEIAGSRS
jgi:hypothetical protein